MQMLQGNSSTFVNFRGSSGVKVGFGGGCWAGGVVVKHSLRNACGSATPPGALKLVRDWNAGAGCVSNRAPATGPSFSLGSLTGGITSNLGCLSITLTEMVPM